MRRMKDRKRYFFVDEAGDPVFYNKYGTCIVGTKGCSKILLLGFVCTDNPGKIRASLAELKNEIAVDPYLQSIPSIKKTLRAFHAKDDCPEVREKVYKLLKTLPFKAEFRVARKIESIFKDKHRGSQNIFYDDLIINLFKDKLHTSKENVIYFAKRGSSNRQEHLDAAIQTSLIVFESKVDKKIDNDIKVFPQLPSDEPCLQVVDYMNWAVQRAFIKGESRYINFVLDKISLIEDMYDFEKTPKDTFYKSKNFDVKKISPL